MTSSGDSLQAVRPATGFAFVDTADQVDAAFPGTTVVLDPGWTPAPGGEPGVISPLPVFSRVLEQHDLFRESLDLIDAWATQSGVVDRLLVEGSPYWFRLRESMWHWVHERLLWSYALIELGVAGTGRSLLVAPASEPALIDVARAMGCAVRASTPSGAPTATSLQPRRGTIRALVVARLPRFIRRAYRRVRPEPAALRIRRLEARNKARDALLNERLERIVREAGDLVLVLSQPQARQAVGSPGHQSSIDPNLGPAVTELVREGLKPLTIGWGIPRDSDEFWPWVESDDRVLPGYFLRRHWGLPEDADRVASTKTKVLRGLGSSRAALAVAGTDLTGPFAAALADLADRIVGLDMRDLACIERMLGELAPRAILMTHEGHRTPWLKAAAARGIDTFALQHGVLYPRHPGYPDHRDSRHILPSRTFVFGDFERRALLEIGYHEAEVEVSGSPRLDLDHQPADVRSAAAERSELRAHLGVAPDDRLLVVSTGWYPFMRRTHIRQMLASLLADPLPGIHVVFKQHPGERDDGPYRAMLDGLARAGGYRPPRMTVVRDVDLYRLLRSADAHLGHMSTVLTEAVLAGTCNLVADVQASPPPLDYVGAGVGFPVRSVADLKAAMAALPAPSPEARGQFLHDHFRPGNAAQRIASAIAAGARSPVAGA